MCDASPFQQVWLDSYSPQYTSFPVPPHGTLSSISPKTSIYGGPGGRRGAVVGPSSFDCEAAQLENIRRGSISTVMGNMNIHQKSTMLSTKTLPVPVINPPLYCDSMLSPPSSPRSAPVQPADDLSARKFQRQIMTTMQALHTEPIPKIEVIDPKDRFTPPPSPGPTQNLEVPRKPTQRKRSRNVAGNPLSATKARRVSMPVASSGAAHTSSRGAVKKASSASCGSSVAPASRRGSARAVEMLEGSLFKSGWSWESAYGNASA